MRNIPLAVVSLLIGLLLCEALARAMHLDRVNYAPQIHRLTPDIVYELIPSHRGTGFGGETVTTDSRGFRSPELPEGKPVIAFLGDSMTFGFGVDDAETAPAVAQRLLPEYAVANASVNGYNVEQEVLTYERKFAPISPAAVVLGFVPNDAIPKLVVATGSSLPATAVPPPERGIVSGCLHRSWLLPLRKRSMLFRWVQGQLCRLPPPIIGPLGREWTEEEFAFYRWWFERLDADVGARTKLFVLWPDRWVYPDTSLRVARLAEDRSWKVLNLGEVLGIRYDNLGWDGHPNAAVQETAGTAIGQMLQRMLPAAP